MAQPEFKNIMNIAFGKPDQTSDGESTNFPATQKAGNCQKLPSLSGALFSAQRGNRDKPISNKDLIDNLLCQRASA